ncbi:MAG: hypothetical protein JSR82_10090 [Verrucomicrobia bacterium]|nr:hypothetical protein [Verrucomicrobiota bacterium]
MKKRILSALAVLALTATAAFAHGDVEIGPNGGRVVDLGSKAPSAEVVLQGTNFVISLYDEAAKKSVPATAAQTLSIVHKESGKKLEPKLVDGKWTVAKPDGKEFWLILTLKDDAAAKGRTGRLHYDEAVCGDCKNPEWICKCAEQKKAKK